VQEKIIVYDNHFYLAHPAAEGDHAHPVNIYLVMICDSELA